MRSHGDMKQKIIDEIIRIEGGYVNNPNDSGGPTKYGITQSVARSFGYSGDMIDLPRDLAFHIYSAKYWDSVHGDDLEILSSALAAEVVDTAVNMGVKRAGEFLQRSINVLNNRGKICSDLVVDGMIGAATVTAVRDYIAARETATLIKALNCLQGAFYIELAERREKDEAFVYGWLRNRVNL